MPRLRPLQLLMPTVRRSRDRATSGLTDIGFWTVRGTLGAMATGHAHLIVELTGTGRGIAGAAGIRATGTGEKSF